MAGKKPNVDGIRVNGEKDKRLAENMDKPINKAGPKGLQKIADDDKLETKKMGRPPLDISVLPEGWELAMEKLGKDGGSKRELMSMLRISEDGIESLARRDDNFKRYYNNFVDDSAAWWEACGRKLSDGTYQHGKPAAWCFVMSNRFGMRSKTEISGDPDRPIKTEMVNKQLTKEELMEELKSRGLPTSIFGNSEDDD